MLPKELDTHIMVDCELAGHPNLIKPAITQIGAIFFDIETGEEKSRFEVYPSLQSCLDHGLVQDHVTMQWVNVNCPQVLKRSEESTVTLKEALQAFIAWIESCKHATYDTIMKSGGRYQFGNTLLWANGSMQDNRWLHFAYETCKLKQPVIFWQYRCAMTANYTASKITKRNFRKEADLDRQGQKHDAAQDCLHQIGWLVKGLNASMRKQVISIPFFASSIPSGSSVPERPSKKRRLDCDDE
ncbi:uncharacterized protein EAE98_001142 [Botrytis deweyae]|uniref:3'-5' exoribonuclease Rv2179c-like domain-containing protein n=1 Tax=Botrytis deweyae TaxID=2478750 RepID=A0ABQ7J1N0_9HELO|nr:uncharacterized protein EAE98_001142 [Botrytis deweyae]KAF7938804.1 hypothetical protein EAE98_001142 [Botrytis deweyae]